MKELLSTGYSFDAEIRKLRKTITLAGRYTFDGITASVDENGLVTWSTNSIDITESVAGGLFVFWSIDGINLPQENYLKVRFPDNDAYNMRASAPLSRGEMSCSLTDTNIHDGDICHLNIFYENESGEQQQITFDDKGLTCYIHNTGPVDPI